MVKKTFVINGVTRNILVDENETLATFLRERLLLTGCKIGCGEGHCGACNVIVNGKVTRSCLTKLGMAVAWLKPIVLVETIIAAVLVIYALVRYCMAVSKSLQTV